MPRSRCLWAFVAAAGLPVAAFGQPTSWLDAVDGTWSDAARWTGGVPGATSDVTIDATGAAYTSTINADFLINSLTLDSADATLVLQSNSVLEVAGTADLNAGLLRLNGGTLRGGTWNVAPGTLSFTSNGNNALEGVALNGDLRLDGTSSTVRLRNGTTISGIIDLAANSVRVGFEGDQTLMSDVVQTGGSIGTLSIEGDSTLTVGAGTSITGTRIDIGSAFAIGGTRHLINDGEILANAANTTGVRLNSLATATNNGTMRATNGGRLQVNSNVASFDNTGMMIAEGGSSIAILASDWTNSGTITATGSTLTFSGGFGTGAVGLTSGGVTGDAASTLELAGVADNTGQTLATDAFGGTIRFNGGSLVGGTLNLIDPANLTFSSNGNNALDNVTVNGTLVLGGQTATLRLRNNTSVSGGVELAGNSARVGLDVGTVLAHDITQTGGSLGSVTLEGTGTVTIANTATITGTRLDIGSAFAVGGTRTLINDGTIVADGSNITGVRLNSIADATNAGTLRATNGGRLQVNSNVAAFANTGAIVAEAGSRVTINAANWTNIGTITAMGDGVIDIDGNASTAAIGLNTGLITGDAASRLNLSAVLDNAGETIRTDDLGGIFAFEAGRINGGTLEIGAGSDVRFNSSGSNVLDGVTVTGDLSLAGSSSTVVFRNGTSVSGEVLLSGNNSRLALDDTQTFNGQIRKTTGNVGSVTVERAGAVVTLGSSASITGSRIDIGSAILAGGNRTLVNEGAINAEGANATGLRVLSLNSFTNDGTIAATSEGRFGVQSTVGRFTNNASITGDANTSIAISAASWNNSAGADITSVGGSVTLGGDWQNDGQISVTDGSLTLGGAFATADIGVTDGRLNRVGSTLNISGVLDNAGATIDTTVLGGTATLTGGTIRGGTIDNTSMQTFGFNTSGNNVLDGVSVLGDLELASATATVRLVNSTTVSDSIQLTGNSARVLFDGTQTFDTAIEQTGTSGSISVERNNSVLTLSNTASVSGGRIDLGNAFIAGGTRSIVNEGSISADTANTTGIRVLSLSTFANNGDVSADVAGSRLSLLSTVSDFSNTGNVHAAAGARVEIDAANWTNETGGTLSTNAGSLEVSGAWTNLGQINSVDGTVDLGGTFTTAGTGLNDGRLSGNASSDLRLSGALDNAGATFNTAAFGGDVTLAGGVITGGTLNVANADAFNFSNSVNNALDGVAVNGDLRLDGTTSTVQLRNGTTISGSIDLVGNSSRILLRDMQVLASDVRSTANLSSITLEGDGTVATIDAGTTVSGPRIDIGNAVLVGGDRTLINGGAIVADGANTTGVRLVALTTLTNNGVFAAVNGGRLSVVSNVADFTNLDTGVLTGGLYRVGESSRLALNGAIQTNAAAIELLGAGAQFDGLNVLSQNEGELTIAADTQFGIDGDLEFASSSTFTVRVTGVGDTIDVPLLNVAGTATIGGQLVLDFTGYASPSEGVFRFLDAGSFAGDWSLIDVVGIDPTLVSFSAGPGTFNLVPAPGALGVLAAGGVLATRRRRSSRRVG
ncbi:MAG: hypothetical protein AAGI53_14325 [Planctomycetota bacterium]